MFYSQIQAELQAAMRVSELCPYVVVAAHRAVQKVRLVKNQKGQDCALSCFLRIFDREQAFESRKRQRTRELFCGTQLPYFFFQLFDLFYLLHEQLFFVESFSFVDEFRFRPESARLSGAPLLRRTRQLGG